MTPKPGLDFRNVNSLWGSVLVETLVQIGVTQAVISPGSRSTPLTVAFARQRGVECLPVLDERSAAFYALGLARRSQHPVALLCTSGTAGANYFPAVIEAQESHVPLIVLTADRPPEMRECRSGQTIDQQKLFGTHVNYYHELALPAADMRLLRYLRQAVAHAGERAQWPVAGPVHLNVPFRDPLAPVADGSVSALRGRIGPGFFAHLARVAAPVVAVRAPVLPAVTRGLIVAGPSRPADIRRHASAVATLSRHTGWPVLADGLSQLRSLDGPARAVVVRYDVLARNAGLMRKLRPEFVLCLGGWPISKPLRAWLEAVDAPVWLASELRENPDALHGRTTVLRTGVEVLAAAIPAARPDGSYRAAWLAADRRVNARLEATLARVKWMFEGKASWLLPSLLPSGTPVFVANSMPVRDVEYFWPANDRGHPLFFNRGANGIDGTLSTALGVAHGGRPAVLLTGDLALLHDTNGFLSLPGFRGSLTIVLINNNGGGIFEHLPVAGFEPPFEKFFATPQEADFRKLASAYGARHVRVRSWSHFAALLRRLPRQGVRVLELRTDRKRDAAFRRDLFARLSRVG